MKSIYEIEEDWPKNHCLMYPRRAKKRYAVGLYEVKSRKVISPDGRTKREKFLAPSKMFFLHRANAIKFAKKVEPLPRPFTEYSGAEVYQARAGRLIKLIHSTIKKHLEE